MMVAKLLGLRLAGFLAAAICVLWTGARMWLILSPMHEHEARMADCRHFASHWRCTQLLAMSACSNTDSQAPPPKHVCYRLGVACAAQSAGAADV